MSHVRTYRSSSAQCCSIPHSGWLASWPSTGSCVWSAAVLREQHALTNTLRHPWLLKPSPGQSCLAQHSLRASAVWQAVKRHAGGQIVILLFPPGGLTVAAGPAKAWGTASFLFVLRSTWSGQTSFLSTPPDTRLHWRWQPWPYSHTQTAPAWSRILLFRSSCFTESSAFIAFSDVYVAILHF